MAKSKVSVEMVFNKVLNGKSCRGMATQLGVSKSTVGNRTKGYNSKSSLANALARDYLGSRSRLTAKQQEDVKQWVRDNILELATIDGVMSIGQESYRTRQETQVKELGEWVDWFSPEQVTGESPVDLNLKFLLVVLDTIPKMVYSVMYEHTATMLLLMDGLSLDAHIKTFVSVTNRLLEVD